jgi:hypothetical protein
MISIPACSLWNLESLELWESFTMDTWEELG